MIEGMVVHEEFVDCNKCGKTILLSDYNNCEDCQEDNYLPLQPICCSRCDGSCKVTKDKKDTLLE
jgi:hypothetical protein